MAEGRQGGLHALPPVERGPFNRPVAEFGENVWYLPAKSAGMKKFEARWSEGAWLGVRLEIGEAIIGTSVG